MGRSQDPGKSAPLTGFVAWLRGVNIGGANRLAMADLRTLFAERGASGVETYIQSGNVAFSAPSEDAPRIAAEVEAKLARDFAVRTKLALVEAASLRRIVDANPFLSRGEDPAKLHVAFFSAPVAPERLAGLDPDRSPPDEFAPGENCLYLFLPLGVARTKLSNAWLDARLGVTTTARNWATAMKMLAIAEAPAAGRKTK